MCDCNCGNKGCGDIKTIPGPKGEQGEQGPIGPPGQNGTDGADGAPGSGGFQFEHWFSAPLDLSWITSLQVQPEFNHVITGGDGNYQIHLSFTVDVRNVSSGQFRLLNNGTVILDQSDVISDVGGAGGQDLREFSIFWRGFLTNGNVISLEHFINFGSIGSVKGNMLINKEV